MHIETLICLGHAALDRIYTVPHLPEGSTKVRATAYREVGGGMASSAACAIARLADPARHRVEFWGRVGDDSAATIIARDLARFGVDTTHLRTYPGRMSSQSAVMVDPAGERMIVNYRGDVPTDDVAWLPLDRVGDAAVVLTDVRWLEGARALLDAARAARVPSVLDADLGDVPIVRALVPLAEHAVFSEPGLRNWSGHDDLERALREAVDAGARVAGVTRGADGSTWLVGGALRHVPTVRIEVVDTLGAGDVFHGAYAIAIAEGKTVLEAARFASVAAAIKCSRHGGRAGAPARSEVDTLLAETA
jgi:sulfofructose kinase